MAESITTSEDAVSVRAKIPADLHERFIRRFPQHGSMQWWVNAMMSKFMDQVEQVPDAGKLMEDTLENYLRLR